MTSLIRMLRCIEIVSFTQVLLQDKNQVYRYIYLNAGCFRVFEIIISGNMSNFPEL